MSFKELTEWYFQLEKVKAIKTVSRIQIALNNFNKELGEKIVGEVKPVDLENYQIKRRAKIADSTIDKELSAVQTMINQAFFNDLVGGDTLKTFKRVKRLTKHNANARSRVLSIEEYQALMEHLPAHLKPIVGTAFYTGMRRGEILKLRWTHVDLKKRLIRLPAQITKEGKFKVVPIGKTLLEILENVPRGLRETRVFLRSGKPLKGDLRTGLRRACQTAGVIYGQKAEDGFTFHDLRQTFATIARRAGVSRNVIMAIMGHSSNDMNFRHDAVDESDLLAAMDKIEAYFADVTQTVTQAAQNEKG